MSFLLALIQFIFISGILIFEVKRKSPAMFLWATLFLMFGMMHFIDAILGVDDYSSEVKDEASTFVIFFCMLYFIVRYIIGKNKSKVLKNEFSNISKKIKHKEPVNLLLLILFIVASVVISWDIIISSGGILNTSWGGMRELTLEKSYLSMTQVFTVVFNALGGILCFSILKKNKTGILISGLCLIFVQIVTRNRVLVLPLLISIITVFIFRLRIIQFRSIIIGILAAIVVVYIVYAIRAFRWLGTLDNALKNFDFKALNEQIKYFLVSSDGELGLRKWMYYFIQNDNNFKDFGQGHTYLRILLVYIPTRFSFGLKPDDFAITMGSAIGMLEGGSMHPTLFGDCYANFGYFGVLFGGFWAFMMGGLDWIVMQFRKSEYKVLAFILIATSCVIMGRGAVYNGFIDIAWGIPVLGALSIVNNSLPSVKRSLKNYAKRKI